MADLTTNEALVDRGIRHATFVERFKTTVVKDIVGTLNSEVIPDLLQQIERTNLTTLARKRLEQLIVSLRTISTAGSVTMHKDLQDLLTEFSVMESDFQLRLLNKSSPINLDFVSPSAASLRATVVSQPMRGRTLRKWFDKQSRQTIDIIDQNIRIGLAQGESIPQIVRRFKGPNSVLNATRRQTEAIVRTAVNHVSSQAKEEMFKANEDVIKGVQWVSTLDSRTTDICAGLDGRVFPVDEGIRPPAHFACRSTMVSVLKSFKELGITGIKEIPEGTRIARPIGKREIKDLKRQGATKKEINIIKQQLNGKVPARVTYGEWLKKQSVDVQNEVLGVGRAQLFRSGKVSIEKFTTNQQRSLSLKEIRKREGIPEPKKKKAG